MAIYKRIIIAATLILGAVHSIGALAQSTYEFNLPRQSLADALREIGRETAMNIIFDPKTVESLTAPAVYGVLTPEDAIKRVIAGTNLVVQLMANNAVVVTVPGKSAAGAQASESAKGAKPTADASNGNVAMDVGSPSRLSQASGQTADQSGKPLDEKEEKKDILAEIVVTAQKTVQRLQDVPLSISAITGAEIAKRNVTALQDLEYSIPGLSTVDYGPGASFVQIRGVSNSLGSPTVGIYLDEMPLDTLLQGYGSIDIRMLDLQRVEVLRGPQGTLYGEGSMGGTIRYITASPDLHEVSGSVEGEVNTVADGGTGYKANAVLNVPLVKDVFGARVMVADEKDAGWIDDPVLGQKNVNAAEFKTIRANFLLEPAVGTKATLLALHQEMDQSYQNFGVGGVTTAVVPPYNNAKYNLINAVLNHDFGSVELVESLGYLDNRARVGDDLTPFYLPVLEAPPPNGLGLLPGFITSIAYDALNDSKMFANETRLSSKGGSRFNWTAGFYYRWGETTLDSKTTTAPGVLPFTLLLQDVDLTSKAWAVFGEANYQFTPQLNGAIGLRYFADSRNQVSDTVSLGSPAHDVNAGDFHSLDPRFNLRYEFSPASMLYVNIAKGFRSGGFNFTSAGHGIYTIPPTYAPDSLWSYEVGTKQLFFDRKLEIQAAVYYEDWKDVQSYEYVPGSAIAIIVNSGHVSGWGTDLQAAWHATPNLDLTVSYGWNNLAFDGDTADKHKDDPVDFAVYESGSASLDYHRPIGKNTGFFRLDYQYAGASQITVRNFGNEINHNPARSTLGSRIGMDLGRYQVSLFATNLTNDRRPVVTGPYSLISNNIEQQPRTIGVNIRANF